MSLELRSSTFSTCRYCNLTWLASFILLSSSSMGKSRAELVGIWMVSSMNDLSGRVFSVAIFQWDNSQLNIWLLMKVIISALLLYRYQILMMALSNSSLASRAMFVVGLMALFERRILFSLFLILRSAQGQSLLYSYLQFRHNLHRLILMQYFRSRLYQRSPSTRWSAASDSSSEEPKERVLMRTTRVQEIMKVPHTMQTTPIKYPRCVLILTSPQPTVVMVMKVNQKQFQRWEKGLVQMGTWDSTMLKVIEKKMKPAINRVVTSFIGYSLNMHRTANNSSRESTENNFLSRVDLGPKKYVQTIIFVAIIKRFLRRAGITIRQFNFKGKLRLLQSPSSQDTSTEMWSIQGIGQMIRLSMSLEMGRMKLKFYF